MCWYYHYHQRSQNFFFQHHITLLKGKKSENSTLIKIRKKGKFNNFFTSNMFHIFIFFYFSCFACSFLNSLSIASSSSSADIVKYNGGRIIKHMSWETRKSCNSFFVLFAATVRSPFAFQHTHIYTSVIFLLLYFISTTQDEEKKLLISFWCTFFFFFYLCLLIIQIIYMWSYIIFLYSW